MAGTQKNIRIGILDDHLGFLQMVTGTVDDMPGMKVTLVATGIPELLHKLQSKTIDILLLDLSLSAPEQGQLQVDGDAVMPELAEKYPGIKVIIYTQHNDASLMARMMDKGARGYLCKTTGIEELETALRKVAETGWYFTDELSLAMNNRMKQQGKIARGSGLLAGYSKNQLECWRHTVNGLTVKETADKMHKSPSAVKGYRRALKKKAGCKTIADLIRLGLKLGLGKEELS